VLIHSTQDSIQLVTDRAFLPEIIGFKSLERIQEKVEVGSSPLEEPVENVSDKLKVWGPEVVHTDDTRVP